MLNAYRDRLSAVLNNAFLPKSAHFFLSLSMIFLLVALCASIMMFMVFGILKATFGVTDMAVLLRQGDLLHFVAFLMSQSIIMAVGAFLLPSFAFYWLQRQSYFQSALWNHLPSLRQLNISLALMLFTALFIPLLVEAFTAIPLPESLTWLKNGQSLNDDLMDSLFQKADGFRYFLLILFVALLPAIAEESFFRGTLQQSFLKSMSPSAAIVTSALCFSLFHGQFNNFLAIWWMGIILGFICFFTQSLWPSVVAHFLNNFVTISGKLAITKGWLYQSGKDSFYDSFLICVPAGILMCLCLWLLAKKTVYIQGPEQL
ncbi:MAG: type II CAAX endopeptidase family protein [Chitinophagales bacterium]